MDISFARGDSYNQGFLLTARSTGEPITETFDEIYFTVKKRYTDKNVVLQKTMTGGGIVSDGDGHYTLTLLPSDTETLQFGEYDFDIELDKGGNFVKTFSGKFNLLQETTHVGNK